jgi:hypothetical protein
MPQKSKLNSDDGDSGSKKSKSGYGGVYGAVWFSLRLEEVWSQAVSFVLIGLTRTWLQSL